MRIVISDDADEATRRMERDAQAEAKRQQNALPAWHLKSTISGDLTALGIKEAARANPAGEAVSSNDEILRGLGVVGARPSHSSSQGMVMEVMEDVKPVVDHEKDCKHVCFAFVVLLLSRLLADYDAYYASLTSASASQSNSSIATPTLAFEDEERDEKPSIEYLTSLNDYRKRSRSDEDVGAGRSTSKTVKTEPDSHPAFEEPVPMTVDDPTVYG